MSFYPSNDDLNVAIEEGEALRKLVDNASEDDKLIAAFWNDVFDNKGKLLLTTLKRMKGHEETWAKNLNNGRNKDAADKINSIRRYLTKSLLFPCVNSAQAIEKEEGREKASLFVKQISFLKEVLEVILPLDRANSLLNMKLSSAREHGFLWINELDLEILKEQLPSTSLIKTEQFYSIDEKYYWLITKFAERFKQFERFLKAEAPKWLQDEVKGFKPFD